jgi:hypothetical protein
MAVAKPFVAPVAVVRTAFPSTESTPLLPDKVVADAWPNSILPVVVNFVAVKFPVLGL